VPLLVGVLGIVVLSVLGVLSALIGPRGPYSGPQDGSPYVRTDTTYLAAGRDGVTSFITERGHPDAPALAAVLETVQHSIVRVRVQHTRGDDTTTHSGSGVVLAGGDHVVTASHTLAALDERSDCRITVALTDGTLRAAEVVRRTKKDAIEQVSDWAVLRLERPAPVGTGLRVRFMSGDELVGVLGYPEVMGSREDGTIVEDSSSAGVVLLPLTVIGKGVMYLDVEILAGSVPRNGASGAPFIGLDGAVLGLFHGIRTRRDEDGVARFAMIPTSPEGLLGWLATELPDAIAD